MNKFIVNFAAGLVVSSLSFLSNPAYGESFPIDFHANARMQYEHHGAVDKTYGLVNVVTDDRGQGHIDVMFSNGSNIDWVKFNAQVKFINASGSIIKEEHIYRWLNAAGDDGAAERKVTKSLNLNDVVNIEVDFYLSNVSDSRVAESNQWNLSSIGSLR